MEANASRRQVLNIHSSAVWELRTDCWLRYWNRNWAHSLLFRFFVFPMVTAKRVINTDASETSPFELRQPFSHFHSFGAIRNEEQNAGEYWVRVMRTWPPPHYNIMGKTQKLPSPSECNFDCFIARQLVSTRRRRRGSTLDENRFVFCASLNAA